ncbi:maestro heat-like repeat-containing protein family member 1 isoform X1 [Metopolophium dirhodum]|uniref:maestro heat-like repeat-containing protein family member 1 isoform X1 n=1 Tax=Metopolophium dirhodum TaxID=44670 RepID=UPI00298FBC04|nr:maestro heat-like repeat-containing protein family member 1 isoform X1 [Metopolophium dirhodum]
MEEATSNDVVDDRNLSMQSTIDRLLHMITEERDEMVLNSVLASLQTLSKSHSTQIVQNMIHYKLQNSLSVVESKSLLSAMKQLCESHYDDFDIELTNNLVQFATNEMFKSSDSQFPASDMLIILGRGRSDQIIQNLMSHLKEGIPPHPSIIYSLGHLASNHPLKFINFVDPFLSAICSILLLTKSDALRKIYGTAIGQVCASVIECEPSDINEIKQNLSPKLEEIYKIMNDVWLISKDMKLIEHILDALSSIVMLMSIETLNRDCIPILTNILSLYKKCLSMGMSRYWVSQYLASFLSVIPEIMLEPVIDNLFSILHEMVIVMPDYDFPMSIKNHSEVLRCYTYLGKHFGDKICELILRDLKSNSEQGRMGALLIASHLLNASNQSIKVKSSEIIPILYDLLKNNSSYQMKNLLVKIFICFAYQGHLTEKDDYFIEFLIKNICYYGPSNNKYSTDNDGLLIKQTCEDAIYILCTSIEPVQVLCWNKLLTFLLSNEYENAVPSITRSLAHMATKSHLRSIRFEKEQDLIIARCLFLLCQPFRDNRGSYVINFLLNYGFYDLSDNEKEFWTKHAEVLTNFLDSASEKSEKDWEVVLLSRLSIILDECTLNKHWCLALVGQLFDELIKNSENTKIFSSDMFLMVKIISYVAAYFDSEELSLTKKLLYFIFQTLLKTSFENSHEFSRAIGVLSQAHTGIVVNKLLEFTKSELTKQPNKFLVLIRDKGNEVNRDKIRSAISIIIPDIVKNGKLQSVIYSMYDIVILVTHQITLTKNLETKKSLVECLQVLANVMSNVEISDTIPNLAIIRDTVIKNLVNQIVNSNLISDYIYYQVLASYIKPVPHIEPIDLSTRTYIITKCVEKIFLLSSSEIVDTDGQQTILTLGHLCKILDQLLIIRSGSFEVVDEIVLILDPYIVSQKKQQRFIAVYLLQSVLNCYYSHSNSQLTNLPICLNSSAPLFAKMCVRIAEPDLKISLNVFKCLDVLLKITAVYKGTFTESYINESEFVDKILYSNKPESCRNLLEAIQKILKPSDLPVFCKLLIDGLNDHEEKCQFKTSEILNILFPIVAQQLNQKACNDILNYLFKELENSNDIIKANNIKALITFGKFIKSDFIELLINQSLPFNKTVCAIWQSLGKDQMCSQIIDTLIEFITLTPLYDTSTKQFLNKPVASLIPISALSGLNEVLKQISYDSAINSFPKLFNIIFLTFSALIDVRSPIRGTNKNLFVSFKEAYDINPAKIAHKTLYHLFKSIKLEECSNHIMQSGNCLDTTVDIIMHKLGPCIIKGLVETHFELISKIISNFDQNLNNTLECQRIAIVVLCLCCTETVTSDVKYTTNLINIFLKCLNDTSYDIKKYCLKGLTVICQHQQILSENQSQYILDALMQGLDEYQTLQSDVTLEALRGLISLVPHLSLDKFEKHYTTLTFRIKQFFENENNEMRYTSIRLYGELCSKTKEFNIQVDMSLHHSNMVTFLLHLCENDTNIVKACKYSLKKISILLHSEKMITMTHNHLIEEGRLKYTEFITQMCKIMTDEFLSHVTIYTMVGVSYSKSIFPDVRANAALFVGSLYKANPSKSSFDLISSKMLNLTIDPNPKVRTSAVACLGKLYE